MASSSAHICWAWVSFDKDVVIIFVKVVRVVLMDGVIDVVDGVDVVDGTVVVEVVATMAVVDLHAFELV